MSLVHVRSGLTVYVKSNEKVLEPAFVCPEPKLIPIADACTLPVPSPLNVRTPSTVNEWSQAVWSVGKNSLGSKGLSETLQVALPVKA